MDGSVLNRFSTSFAVRAAIVVCTHCLDPEAATGGSPEHGLYLGAPVICNDHIVFSVRSSSGSRLIALAKATGEKLWEVIEVGKQVRPCAVDNGRVIAIQGGQIHTYSLTSGRRRPFAVTQFHVAEFVAVSGDRIFFEGVLLHPKSFRILKCFGLSTGSPLWLASPCKRVLTVSSNLLLLESARVKTSDSGDRLESVAQIDAISIATGRKQWSIEMRTGASPISAALNQGIFLIATSERVECYREVDGGFVGRKILSEEREEDATLQVCKSRLGFVLIRQFQSLQQGHEKCEILETPASSWNLNPWPFFRRSWNTAWSTARHLLE